VNIVAKLSQKVLKLNLPPEIANSPHGSVGAFLLWASGWLGEDRPDGIASLVFEKLTGGRLKCEVQWRKIYDGKERDSKEQSGRNGFDFNKAGTSVDYDEVIRSGAPAGADVSAVFHATIGHLSAKGLSVDKIVEVLSKWPNGIARRYAAAARRSRALVREVAKQAQDPRRRHDRRARRTTDMGGDRQKRSALSYLRQCATGPPGPRGQIPLRRLPRQEYR